MFARNYYSLVAGLREYALDADNKGFDVRAIREAVEEELSPSDARAESLLYRYYDCENIIRLHDALSARNPLGNLSEEELAAELRAPEVFEGAMALVLSAYASPEGEAAETVDVSQPFAHQLLAAYYDECERSSSRFMREWARFDRTLRNLSSALIAREEGRAVEEVAIGSDETTEQIRRSSAADFGLRGELPYIDALITALADEQNILEKERRVDIIRWQQADALSETDYFNINAVMAYLVKVNIVARWSRLDARRGREMFNRLLADLDGKDLMNKQ